MLRCAQHDTLLMAYTEVVPGIGAVANHHPDKYMRKNGILTTKA